MNSTTIERDPCVSVFAQGLGEAFRRLDPHTQERFGLRAGMRAQLGVGVVDITVAPWARPFLRLWSRQHIAVRRNGRNVPFTILNVPFIDALGREGVTVSRRFFTRGAAAEPERFDATMLSAHVNGLVDDLLGSQQNVLARLTVSVDERDGGMRFTSNGLRWIRRTGRQIVIPSLVAGQASVHEWWDNSAECFRISVEVRHPFLGTVFAYDGHFSVTEVNLSHPMIADALPCELRRIDGCEETDSLL